MFSFITVFYIISLLISFLTFISAIFVLFFRLHVLKILPKALRLYLMICFFPFIVVMSTATSVLAIIYFVCETQSSLTTDIINYFLAIGCQMIRSLFFLLILERIVATYYFETYTFSYKKSLSGILSISSFAITLFYVGFLGYAKNVGFVAIFMQIVNYFVFCVHTFTLVICIILYYLNKKMYKMSAYRINLKTRHQILENVKVLAYLLPSILIHTCLTPMGAIVSLIITAYKLPAFPSAFMHIFYNLPLLLICIRQIRMNANVSDMAIGVVQNAFGKSLPTTLPPDNYFQGLQQQWK